MVISGITNVVLNVIFVVAFNLGVAGVAIATAISQAVSSSLVWFTLMKEDDATKLIISRLKVDGDMALSIIKIGIPAGIQSAVFSLSNVIIQTSINSFDSSVIVAGNGVASNLENFISVRWLFLRLALPLPVKMLEQTIKRE